MKTHHHIQHAVVVADAPLNDIALFRDLIQHADVIIAADGGARYVLMLNMLPQVAIGDFDSLAPPTLAELEQAGVQILRYPVHKNETDLELALLHAVQLEAQRISVLAGLGGRPDQHLANLQLLCHPAFAGLDVRLLHERWEVVAVRSSMLLSGAPGDIVSLLPMTEEVTGIVTTGLYYPLQHETLRLGPARGVSNVMVEQQAQISVENGILLCMHECKQ